MPSNKLDIEMEKLRGDLKSMSRLVRQALKDSMTALKNRDVELSSKVVQLDNEKIDVLYREIEERCTHCIALLQPVAGDLRFISTTITVTTNLERIGDYAKDIAMVVPYIANEKPSADVEKVLAEMNELAIKMTKNSVDSFTNKDIKKVYPVMADEEKMDSLYGNIFPKIKERANMNPDNVSLSLNLLLVARYLERIGDHAMNISKRSIYVIKGAWEYLYKPSLLVLKDQEME